MSMFIIFFLAFQIITEYDIYTLSFESDNAKWDCMNGFWKILSSLVKADPTVTKCYAAIKDYEDDALEVAIVSDCLVTQLYEMKS